MKFKYIECGADSPKTAVAFGHEFVLNGDAVEVTDRHAIAKLSNNASFVAVNDGENNAPAPTAKSKPDTDKPKATRSK